MKTLLPALLLLATPSLANVVPPELIQGSPEVMGPPCPAEICGPKNDAQAAAVAGLNAANTGAPDGFEWASPDCTRIPCALKERTPDPAPKDPPASARSAPPASGTRVTPLPDGKVSTNIGGRALVCDLGDGKCVPEREDPVAREARERAERERLAAENKGFDPTGGFGRPGPAAPRAADPPPESDAFLYGRGVGNELDGILSGNGDGLLASNDGAPKGGQPAEPRKMAWTADQAFGSSGGLISLTRAINDSPTLKAAARAGSLGELEPAAASGPEPEGCRRGGSDLAPCLGASANR